MAMCLYRLQYLLYDLLGSPLLLTVLDNSGNQINSNKKCQLIHLTNNGMKGCTSKDPLVGAPLGILQSLLLPRCGHGLRWVTDYITLSNVEYIHNHDVILNLLTASLLYQVFLVIWRDSHKRGVYRFFGDFFFLQDLTKSSHTDLFWHVLYPWNNLFRRDDFIVLRNTK